MTSQARATSPEGTSSDIQGEDGSPEAIMDKRTPSQPATRGRTQSHSLLSASPRIPTIGRKSRFSDPDTTGTAAERASISMPPPTRKPSKTTKTRPVSSLVPNSVPIIDGTQEGDETANEAVGMLGLHKTPSSADSHVSAPEMSQSGSLDVGLKSPSAISTWPGDRLSLSSLQSLGSAIINGMAGPASTTSAPLSATSSHAGSISGVSEQPSVAPAPVPISPPLGSTKGEAMAPSTTATDPITVIAHSETVHHVPSIPTKEITPPTPNATVRHMDSWNTAPTSRPSAPRRSRSRHQGPAATSTVASSAASPSNSDRVQTPFGKVGICALDVKARSKASRNILTRLSSNGEFDVMIFGDKVILDEAVENWPKCDFLISFFSDGFPLDKAIAYQHLRKPFLVNDLPMQKILWDRRLCLRILDKIGVPTPQRVEISRDGGPTLESAKLAEHLYKFSGVRLEGPADGTGGGIPKPKRVEMSDDGDSIVVDGMTLRKPFVEKPVSGEDHNIHIYFPRDQHGGGGRRLFRKIGNKSSEWDENMRTPRSVTEEGSSYVYEQFLDVDNAEDIKAYTVGPEFCHAETRTSPVVDGLVRRNTHGKEIRYICKLKPEEQTIARRIANGFGQRVCGFDMLRVKNQSFVIDVNGWSFVKDNNDYYDKSAKILKEMFLAEKRKKDGIATPIELEQPVDKVSIDKSEPDKASNHRKNTLGGHRSEFVKKLMKSPSMSKLRGHHHQGGAHSHGTASPEPVMNMTPLSSPPSMANESKLKLPQLQSSSSIQLPPSALPNIHSTESTEDSTSPEIPQIPAPEPSSKHAWKLKGMVSVIRHADRTPKQKLKFTFHTKPFVDLLKGHQEEVLLKGELALNSVSEAAKTAMQEGIEDFERLKLLQTSLARKGAWTGTKVQIKPMFRKRRPEEIKKIKSEIAESAGTEALIAAEHLTEDPVEVEKTADGEHTPLSRPPTRSDSLAGTTLSRFSAAENDLILDKLQLIVKWGGEPTHSARYQAQDLGENMRADILLMNKQALENVRVFSSSERRVTTSAQIWAASFLNQKEVDDSTIKIRKDLLDDSNAAKDVMDKVKKELKLLLREGHSAPPQFAWPANTPEPSVVVRKVAELMVFHREVMRQNFKRLEGGALSALNKVSEGASDEPNSTRSQSQSQGQNSASIQARWCCGENPELFKERWEKLFSEFCDSEKIDPSKISELYDTMKFDALHNRPFLEWVFTPPVGISLGSETEETEAPASPQPESKTPSTSRPPAQHERKNSGGDKSIEKPIDKSSSTNLAQRMGLRRKSMMNHALPSPPPSTTSDHLQESYFKLFSGTGQSRAKQDIRLSALRDLYKYAKVLFDFVCPQEYGISNDEKLEIGLLTSLPLLKEIVNDLEEVQASEDAKSFVYFTKESHIYTLLNCIFEGGIKTKIERNAIPELDYLSNITFELYESEDQDEDVYTYSIRIGVTPGCHTFDPLDVQLDSKHSIGCAPRRSLTAHSDWKEVIETLRAKFHTVKLPKSFLAVNVSEGHGEGEGGGGKSTSTSDTE
ncbi:uncharacterized protein KY384_005582 [Bacidia gigantensis]|uniref:uncharacterized protein n=1 Tax=Bacidia gigantensis TaxID=2732470 RepID=UPI001D052836|nr:uncharacterized protein KY384_005582 [Bacidia gigantensis]KAG8530100.1 hypothetical protein KY384_005582 [Bacidia gigantensis]